VKTPPSDLDEALVQQVLEQRWGIRAAELRYLPVGFGDHHWQAISAEQRYFVTVRDLRLDGLGTDRRDAVRRLEATFRAIRQLKDLAQLPFIVAPMSNSLGTLVVPLGDRFAITVYDWLELDDAADAESTVAAELVARLHRASREHRVPAPTEDFSIPHRSSLEKALADLERPWHDGPFSEPARSELLAHHTDVRAALADYDALVSIVVNSVSTSCVTHGEPSGGNLVRDQVGSWFLVDWESARIAPPERDLMELPSNEIALARYLELSGSPPPRPDLLRLYQLWYALAETSVYLLQFRAPHVADDNMLESWRNYLTYLPGRLGVAVIPPGAGSRGLAR
jgi:spectinomycin phosphotransferase